MNSKKTTRSESEKLSTERHFDAAKVLHQLGRLDDAQKRYEQILRQDGNNAEVLGLLADVLLQRGDVKSAKKLWRRSLANKPPGDVFLRNLHAYLQLLVREGRHEQAAVLASYEIPEWPLCRLPDASEGQMLMRASDMLVALDQTDTAARLLSSVLKSGPKDVSLLYALARNQMARQATGLAWRTLSKVEQIIQPAFDLQLMVDLYSCASTLGDAAAADAVSKRVVWASPALMAPRRATQKADVLVLNGKPNLGEPLSSFEDLHLSENFPAQLAPIFADEFHFSYVFAADEAGRAVRDKLPRPDFVINNNVNGEQLRTEGNLRDLTAFAESFGVPVVNHPGKALPTARDVSAELIADLPGVLVPKTQRFCSTGKTPEELVREIEEHFAYPLITRTLAAQVGHGMTKIDTHEALLKALSIGVPEGFFVTEFVDSRGGSEIFRKIRAAVVGDEIIVIRADYDTYWNVHGRQREARHEYYLANPRFLDDEKKICETPEDELGTSAMRSLRAIRERIPLDVFGVDFDVDADGVVVFYEANATMNLFGDAKIPRPEVAEDRLKDAFRRYFASLLKSSRRQAL